MRALALLTIIALTVLTVSAHRTYNNGHLKALFEQRIAQSIRQHPEKWAENPVFHRLKEFAKSYFTGRGPLDVFTDADCENCKEVMDSVFIPGMQILPWEDIEFLVVDICKGILEGESGDTICPGVIRLQGKEVHRIITMKNKVWTGEYICTVMNACIKKDKHDNIFLGNPPPAPIVNDEITHQSVKADILKVVQLADIHTDTDYAEGAPSECKMAHCCRWEWKGTGKAQKWGEHVCNIPQRTVDALLDEVNSRLQPDMVIYTGDSPPHTMWDETLASQLNCSELVFNNLRKRLPGIPVYPNIGNHELFPTNLYYQPNNWTQTTNKKFAKWWKELLPSMTKEQIATIEYAGYYSMMAKPGLRVLSFNTIVGYTNNWYVLLNDDVKAYADQKSFMNETLFKARTDSEKVIMVGHVPPGGSDSLEDFNRFYRDLAIEYKDVIVLQVYGHTHQNDFRLFMGPSDTSAESVLFISPSVTPSSSTGGPNPSVRVYHLDRRTFQLVDYQQFYINLTKANENPGAKPTIELLYSARKEYNLTDMSPNSYSHLSKRLETDEVLARYRWNQRTGIEPGPCDEACKRNHICSTRHVTFSGYWRCTQGDSTTTTKAPVITSPPTKPPTTPKSSASVLQVSVMAMSIVLGCTLTNAFT